MFATQATQRSMLNKGNPNSLPLKISDS